MEYNLGRENAKGPFPYQLSSQNKADLPFLTFQTKVFVELKLKSLSVEMILFITYEST